jgi:hypothetical protein
MTSVEQTIRQLESELREATLKNDAEATNRFLADTWINTNANGTITEKKQLLATINSFQFISIEDEDVRIDTYENVAIVTGGSTRKLANPDGSILSRQVRFTRVYVNQGEIWQVVAAQATPIT